MDSSDILQQYTVYGMLFDADCCCGNQYVACQTQLRRSVVH